MPSGANRRRISSVLALLGAATACGDPASGGPPADGGPSGPRHARWEGTRLLVDVPPASLEPGGELVDLCFSAEVGNEAPIFVSSVTMHGTTGVHHSNWFFVPSSRYAGPDGLFPCDERSFDQAVAATLGGVLFAQTTQVADETMEFAPGAALALPARARIVANLHYVNWGAEALAPTIDLELTTIPEADVRTILHGFTFSYDRLVIPPHGESEFTTTCDVASRHESALGRPLDFRIHYVLPHYHGLGTYLALEVVGGPNDGAVIWETNGAVGGEPLGGRPDPAFDMTGATGVRLTCRFVNPGDATVYTGNRDGEMCIAFGYSDSPNLWATIGGDNEVLGVTAGVTQNTSTCTVITARPSGG